MCLGVQLKRYLAVRREELWKLRRKNYDHRENRKTKNKLPDKLGETGYRFQKPGQT